MDGTCEMCFKPRAQSGTGGQSWIWLWIWGAAQRELATEEAACSNQPGKATPNMATALEGDTYQLRQSLETKEQILLFACIKYNSHG